MKKRLLVALAIMAVFLGVGTRTALADVVWQSKTSDHYMAVVYPMPYDFVDAKKRVLAEYAGYNYGSWSTTTRQAIEQGQGGSNPWTRAIEKVYNRAYDYGGGGGGHGFGDGVNLPFSNQIDIAAVLWGDDFVWDVDMTKADYDQLRAYIAYWALPRLSPVKPNEGTGWTKVLTMEPYAVSFGNGRINEGSGPIYNATMKADGSVVIGAATNFYLAYRPDAAGLHDGKTYVYYDKINVMVKNEIASRISELMEAGWLVYGTYEAGTSGPGKYGMVQTDGYTLTDNGTSGNRITFSKNGVRLYGIRNEYNYGNQLFLIDGELYVYESRILENTSETYNRINGFFGLNDGDKYTPTPDPPTTPVNVPEPQAPEPYTPDVPDPVDGTDVTDYLQAIIDALAEHCDHIRAALQDLETGINGYLYDLSEYWNEELPNIIKSGLSDVVHWLKLIYGRILSLATGRPAVDDDGGFDFFQWLTSLVTGFLGGLLGGLAALVSGLGQDASKLITKFPFSLPWDLYGILLLFEAIPQTPVVTLDWPLFNGETFHYVLDFTPWNDMMAICRDVERIVFAGMLIKLTPKFLGESEV